VRVLSFKVFAEEELDKACDWFSAKGHTVEWVERPYQGRTLLTHDNVGIPIEFYFAMDRLESIHQQYALYKGVKPLRIDHFNCFVPNVDDSVAFWGEMGFRVTEYTEDETSGRLWAAWTQRKGGVHDIAFTNGTGPKLHHIAFWVPTPLNIIDISNAFFLYILDPDGHRVEIYCSDYQTLDPDHEPIKWDLKDPQRQTLWGAAAPESWFKHGSVFDAVDVVDSDMKATPIVAP